jgi:hypothetical protein
MRASWRVVALSFLASVPLGSSGCGEREDLGQVSGTVKLDGQPIEGAYVTYIPKGPGGSTSYGRTDDDGEFYLMFSMSVDGASLGESQVTIKTADLTADEKGNITSRPERIPEKYNVKSELVRTVEPGSNRHDFDLTSDGAKPKQSLEYYGL